MAACLRGNSRWPLFCKILLVDTFNLICYLSWFLSVITKRDHFRTRSSDDLGYPHKTSFFSVPNVHPGYYVYQVAPYGISEEKLSGHATHTEPPSDNGLTPTFSVA